MKKTFLWGRASALLPGFGPALLAVLLSCIVAFLSLSRRNESAPLVTSKPKAAFLLRFGVDGKDGVDWSGSIVPPPSRIQPWQFNAADKISGNSWKCTIERQTYWDTPYEARMQPTSRRDKVTEKGILVEYEGTPPPEVQISTRQGNFAFSTTMRPGRTALPFLDGRASVTGVPAVTALTSGPDAEDYPSAVEAKDGTLWIAYQTWAPGGDQIFVRRLRGTDWSQPEALTAANGDYFRTAIAQDASGRIWIVWAAQEAGNFDLYTRSFDGKSWSKPERLTTAENSDIYQSMVADDSGKLYLVYQSARSGNFDIYLRVFDGKTWSPEIQVSSDPANDWEPALAVMPGGGVTIIWDTYSRGNYDVVARTWRNGHLAPQFPVAQTAAFEARPSAQYDRQGRLWVAYEEGDANWGKDYGYEIPESGRGLMVRRQTRVAVVEDGKLLEPAAPILNAVSEDLRQAFQHPALALDGNGNPWVFFRTRVNLPISGGGGKSQYRALWRLEATALRDGRWTPTMELSESYGRIDSPVAVAQRTDGSLAAVWVTDGRTWPLGFPQNQDLRVAALPPAPPGPQPLAPDPRPLTPLPLSHPTESADIARVRDYRVRLGSQTLRIVRGDIHRHTDVSWDGNRDGSLDDSYRYALDAAGFDYLGVCDHLTGETDQIPYNWQRAQKAVDLFTIKGRFAPLYSYERSLKWPNGHRNVFFPTRGRPLLQPSAAEENGTEGAAKLYTYLHKFGGVTSAHTSASGMGTDFRDSDAEAEPVVEIYQGYRSNFETLGAPRSPSRQESAKFSAGFVWNAWSKGIKLGVQASSDHVSTHISYAGLYVDRVDRDAIIAAMKARRSYAATDNILVDLRTGEHFMGESFQTTERLPLSVYAAGTGPIARVEVIKNNRVVYAVPGAGPEARFSYTDQDVQPGESYYYVRIEQTNGQLCWSSPIWVQYHK